MRLINASTLELVSWFGHDPPNYAILSHNWGREEVSLQDLEKPHLVASRLGYQKIQAFCRLCVEKGIEWAWVDTCCIDKTSSVELSEAINSMFKWYSRASICVAYLSDLEVSTINSTASLAHCVWFQRSWTLQELLAPRKVEFYNGSWHQIGNKTTLHPYITAVTGIDRRFLLSAQAIGLACAAQKMSWASKRKATREEDVAYCLLGLFQINMPLLYGEGGTRAFIRLQEEIIKISADHSIFAWFANAKCTWQTDTALQWCSSGLLAPSPAFFAESGRIRRNIGTTQEDVELLQLRSRQPFQMTNRGLQIELPILESTCTDYPCDKRRPSCILALLNCSIPGKKDVYMAIHLRKREFAMFVEGDMWQVSDSDFERVHLNKTEQVTYEKAITADLKQLFVRVGTPTWFEAVSMHSLDRRIQELEQNNDGSGQG